MTLKNKTLMLWILTWGRIICQISRFPLRNGLRTFCLIQMDGVDEKTYDGISRIEIPGNPEKIASVVKNKLLGFLL